jgi:hypothetical protein
MNCSDCRNECDIGRALRVKDIMRYKPFSLPLSFGLAKERGVKNKGFLCSGDFSVELK